MRKLYFPRPIPEHYWECWDNDDGTFTVHWGELGNEGEVKIVEGSSMRSALSKVQELEKECVSKGYGEIEFDDQKVLLIEFEVDGFGSPEDLSKRHSLEDLMNETLGWTGLGHSDGGSIGSGTMEVCCFVVDFDLAKKVISERLQDTEYSDYARIYLED